MFWSTNIKFPAWLWLMMLAVLFKLWCCTDGPEQKGQVLSNLFESFMIHSRIQKHFWLIWSRCENTLFNTPVKKSNCIICTFPLGMDPETLCQFTSCYASSFTAIMMSKWRHINLLNIQCVLFSSNWRVLHSTVYKRKVHEGFMQIWAILSPNVFLWSL